MLINTHLCCDICKLTQISACLVCLKFPCNEFFLNVWKLRMSQLCNDLAGMMVLGQSSAERTIDRYFVLIGLDTDRFGHFVKVRHHLCL